MSCQHCKRHKAPTNSLKEHFNKLRFIVEWQLTNMCYSLRRKTLWVINKAKFIYNRARNYINNQIVVIWYKEELLSGLTYVVGFDNFYYYDPKSPTTIIKGEKSTTRTFKDIRGFIKAVRHEAGHRGQVVIVNKGLDDVLLVSQWLDANPMLDVTTLSQQTDLYNRFKIPIRN